MKTWDDTSSGRLFYHDREQQYANFHAAIRSAPPLAGRTVLDVGCGYGDLIPLLPHDCAYLGVDIDEQVLEAAQALYPDHHFEHIKEDGPIPQADVIFAVAVPDATHNPKPFLKRLEEAARIAVVATMGQQYAEDCGAEFWSDGPALYVWTWP